MHAAVRNSPRMFISDTETSVDLLYYEAIAQTVVKLIGEAGDKPLTIGVHGDWGAGKSSVLLMTEREFAKDKDILCLRFNGWQFQGFEDAKAALIEKIIIELRDARSGFEKVKEQATDLLKRIDYLKLGKKALQYGFTFYAGVPHPETIKDAVQALRAVCEMGRDKVTTDDIGAAVETVEGLLKPRTEKTIPEEMRAFEVEFRSLIELAKLKKLVVCIDDLDRCLPETAIETLEAIRLFLFAPKTAFVIAADEGMIQYAVRKHFPDLPQSSGPVSYAQNYLEKLIQVPFRVPALGPVETQVYSALVIAEAALGSEHEKFKELLNKARQILIKPWAGEILDGGSVQELLKGEVHASVKEAILHSGQTYRVLAEGTKGNPRQIKRFLNAMLLRKAIADARGFGDQIKLPHLAKVMLAEQFHPTFFEQITRVVQTAPDAKPTEIAALESEVRSTKAAERQSEVEEEKSKDKQKQGEWTPDDWAKNWATIDPALANEDLRPYLFITRDKKGFVSGLDSIGHLQSFLEMLMGDEMAVKFAEAQVKKLIAVDAQKVAQIVSAKIIESGDFRQQPKGILGLRTLARHQPSARAILLSVLSTPEPNKIAGWAASALGDLLKYPETDAQANALEKRWRESGSRELKAMFTAMDKIVKK
jgi:predicted KAP-like P-loop ATPase